MTSIAARMGLLGLRPLANAWLLLVLLVFGSTIATLIPSFQSPDEFDHIKRAYLFTKGTILLDTHSGAASGGKIDTGLLAYFRIFQKLPFHPERKISHEEAIAAASIRWTGERAFSEAPGTGYYFPLAYLPQSIALKTGEMLDLSIDDSYRLARFAVLASSLAALVAACAVFPLNSFVLALLLLPMSVFQFLSASLDGFTTALTCLCVALFMRAYLKVLPFSLTMSVLLSACILVLTTSRIQMLPLLVLPLLVWVSRRKAVFLWQFLALSVFALVWTFLSIQSTYVVRGDLGRSTSHLIHFYVSNPRALFDAITNTLLNEEKLSYYKNSFIGILGWIDTRFEDRFYETVSEILVSIAFFSISLKHIRTDWHARIILVALALISSFLVFSSMLITWSADTLPATMIDGVQGRYFIGPAILFAYALSGSSDFLDERWNQLALLPLLVLIGLVSSQFPKVLASRYFMMPSEASARRFDLQPSHQLDPERPVPIILTPSRQDDPTPLKHIGVMFGTYGRSNAGIAELRLHSPDGVSFAQRVSLANVPDNGFMWFDLGSKRITSGEFVSLDGGKGVSTWQTRSEDGTIATCINFEYVNGEKRSTPGCPRP